MLGTIRGGKGRGELLFALSWCVAARSRECKIGFSVLHESLENIVNLEDNLMSNIEERVKAIVVEQLNVSADEVTPEAGFIDDLGADSLDIVELVMALEEEYDVEISDDAAEKIRTVGDAITYIKQHVTE